MAQKESEEIKSRSKYRDKLLKELNETLESTAPGSAKEAILQNLLEEVRANDNDEHIVNTLYYNRDLPLRMFTDDELDNMLPTMKNIMIGEPMSGKVDLKKAFGADWKDKFEEIPSHLITLVAERAGVDPRNLLNDMAEEVTASRRKEAFDNVGGMALGVAAPRIKEAYEAGRDPEARDIAGDIAEAASYAVPYGRAIPYAGKAANFVRGLASNLAPPVVNEAVDRALYNRDTTNARSKFDLGDVGSGFVTNLVVPTVLRGFGRGAKRMGIENPVGDLAEGQSRKEIVEEIKRNLPTKEMATGAKATAAQRKALEEFKSMPESVQRAIETKDKAIFEIAQQPGNSLEEKAQNYIKSKKLDPNTTIGTDYVRSPRTIKEVNLDRHVDDDLIAAYDALGLGATETAKSARRLAVEEAIKNELSNKFGDQYAQGNDPIGKIPVVGNMIQRKVKEKEKEEEEIAELKRLMDKYHIDLLGGR